VVLIDERSHILFVVSPTRKRIWRGNFGVRLANVEFWPMHLGKHAREKQPHSCPILNIAANEIDESRLFDGIDPRCDGVSQNILGR